MLKLYKFGQVGDVCDASSFCAKVEAYFRLANLPYDTASGPQYLCKAPKGKLPFIEDNGKLIADSSFIIRYVQDTYNANIDSHLSAIEKAIAHAFIKMLDENLYWVLVHARWQLPHNITTLHKTFFDSIPFPMNKIIAYTARRDVLSKLQKQGMGRHSNAEITEIGKQDLNALSVLLGDKTYFFGDKPSSLDAAAYATLMQMLLVTEFTAPIFDAAKSYTNLVEFTNRFHAKYFPN
ncbi:glutathione S-transferase family protein [Methylomonas sp. AM2-LC]|uniref:glutathione S-transferase family protein n=1 Tax=Methylomonas sp. AM2-LC TaxID=3153301 RepID=UPI0032665989